MTYGQKITQLRKNANMTQAQLGDALNVSAQRFPNGNITLPNPIYPQSRRSVTYSKYPSTIFWISTIRTGITAKTWRKTALTKAERRKFPNKS